MAKTEAGNKIAELEKKINDLHNAHAEQYEAGRKQGKAEADAYWRHQQKGCTYRFTERCKEHGNYVHGGEAEELRQGVEEIIKESRQLTDHDNGRIIGRLEEMLQRIDARDSLAFLASKE